MRALIIAFLLLAAGLNSWAQVVEVRNFDTRFPVSDVHLYSADTLRTGVTGRDGKVDITHFTATNVLGTAPTAEQRMYRGVERQVELFKRVRLEIALDS